MTMIRMKKTPVLAATTGLRAQAGKPARSAARKGETSGSERGKWLARSPASLIYPS